MKFNIDSVTLHNVNTGEHKVEYRLRQLDTNSKSVAEANKRLLEAAPELLEALKSMLSKEPTDTGYKHDGRSDNDIITQALKAIADAERIE